MAVPKYWHDSADWEVLMDFQEKVRCGREEANKLQLWKEESWTPLLFYIHIKHFSVGWGLGFAMGVLFSTLVYLLRQIGRY